MDTIQIFCKANKRNRDGKSIRVCGHIIRENERQVEEAYTIDVEGNGMLLELTALMNALLDEEGRENLNRDKTLELYVCNEYIYKTLKHREEEKLDSIEEEKYISQWEGINALINQCKEMKCFSTEKKYRDAENTEAIRYMAQLNRLVCEKVNASLNE